MSEPTLGDFYAMCDSAHRELFSVIIREWQETGLQWSWQGEAISLGSFSVIKNEYLHFILLKPGEGVYPATLTLDTDYWREMIGQEEADNFVSDVRAIHGLKHKQRENIFTVNDPGHLSGPTQQRLRDLIKRFGQRIPDLVAS